MSFVSSRPPLRVEGKQSSLFPEGTVIQCFVIPPNSKIKKKQRRKNEFLDAYGGCPQYERQSKPSCPTETTQKVFFFAANKNEDNSKVALASSNAYLENSRFDLTRNSIFCCK